MLRTLLSISMCLGACARQPAGPGVAAGARPHAPLPAAPAAATCAPEPAAPAAAPAAPAPAPELPALPRLSRDQALRDLRIAERTLTELHPGLYRYLTPAELAAELATARAAVADGADLGTMYLLISRLAASVRCGHTWTNPLNQSARVQRELFERADKLPVRLRLVAGRLLVTASADASVPAGAELLTIDGRAPQVLVRELLPYLRADGRNDGKRLIQIDHGEGTDAMDRLFPLLHPPAHRRYRLRLRRAGDAVEEVEVRAVTRAERDAAIAARSGAAAEPDPSWSFTIDGDTARLTLPTFAFWRGEFDWRAFLDDAFAQLDARAVPFLIIDQRRNEGGDGAIVEALLRHLIKAPVRLPARRAEVAYERAPYQLARFLDTWDFRFFDRTGKVTRGPGRNLIYAAASTRGALVQPAARPYRGRTFVLIGPANSSAGFLLAAALKQSGAATLIGQVTGGNQRGLNGGELAWVTLPESGVSFDVPLVAWMPRTPQPDAGIAPDVEVAPAFEDVAAGADPELAAARAQVAARRAGR
ncbi:MAG: S41 family peptidase [Kofleriaceae bacterium]